ncbi:MAG: hypothetical protein KatS3mg102_2359 [Planctomycetota bacterium]|nr:MAG: hypothetical protein KatS3mg102_2359 [Planctomycetota bacterium]
MNRRTLRSMLAGAALCALGAFGLVLAAMPEAEAGGACCAGEATAAEAPAGKPASACRDADKQGCEEPARGGAAGACTADTAGGKCGSEAEARCAGKAGKQACAPAELLRPYFRIRSALAADTLDGVARAAHCLVCASGCSVAGADEAMQAAQRALGAAAKSLLQAAKAGEMERARAAFGELSKAAIAYAEAAEKAGLDLGTVALFECPMAKPFGRWLQDSEAIGNPYYGSRMLKCGKLERTIAGKPAAQGERADACCGGAEDGAARDGCCDE